MTTDEMVAMAKEANRGVVALVEMMRKSRIADAETYWQTLELHEQSALIVSLIRYAHVGIHAMAASQRCTYEQMIDSITRVIDGQVA